MSLIIEKQQIKDFLADLKKDYIVVNAAKSENPLPLAKKYIYPPKEKVLNFDIKKDDIDDSICCKPTVIFGLDKADLEAMTFLDEIMAKPEPDFYYSQRRENTILIGLCECSIDIAPGGDLVFERINADQYQVLVVTERGERVVKSKFIREDGKINKKEYICQEPPLGELLLDSELLSDVIVWSIDHEVWNELDKKCLGCGNCTYVCPLCYCFSMEDRFDLKEKSCSRCRIWDACTLPEFSEVAGGHNFHKTVKSRYYNWFYHKFVRGYKEYGRSLCAACGRCQKYCPAGIDIEKVLLRLIEDYKAKDSK